MPAKTKITRQDILTAALDLLREGGTDAINARAIAHRLGCSTQPIFSNFTSMESLDVALAQEAEALFRTYMEEEVEKALYPPYKAYGMAYIRFAKEESQLFRLLYMCSRTEEESREGNQLFGEMVGEVNRTTGLSHDASSLFHTEMWIYVHGLATMFATEFLSLSWEDVSALLTDMYQALRKQHECACPTESE